MNDFDDTTFVDMTEPTNESLLSLDKAFDYEKIDEVSDINNDENLMPKLRQFKYD